MTPTTAAGARTAKPKYKVHLQRTYQKWGGTVNTTLCGRNSDVAIDTDDENVTDQRDEVTCKFCKRLFPALDRRAALAKTGGA